MEMWIKIRDYAKQKVSQAYTDKHHNDLKCPVCNTWISQVDGCDYSSNDDDDYGIMVCKNCNFSSRWFVGAPVLIHDEKYVSEKIKDGIKYTINMKKIDETEA